MNIKTLPLLLILSATALVAAQAEAQVRAEVEQLGCLLVQENGVVRATIENNVPDSEVRLYFRRLHEEVEDFYFVRMRPLGNGDYWGIFPKAADEILERRELARVREEVRELWAMWWREKISQADRNPNDELSQTIIEERARSTGDTEPRDWMEIMSNSELERWLEQVEYEPAEYFVGVHDGFGERIARSPMRITQVTEDCPMRLSALEAGEAENLVVGETAAWQRGERVFHWLCDGIVSRVGPDGVLRGDEVCRACVVAWWQMPKVLVPAAAGAAGVAAIVFDDDDPPVSPDRP